MSPGGCIQIPGESYGFCVRDLEFLYPWGPGINQFFIGTQRVCIDSDLVMLGESSSACPFRSGLQTRRMARCGLGNGSVFACWSFFNFYFFYDFLETHMTSQRCLYPWIDSHFVRMGKLPRCSRGNLCVARAEGGAGKARNSFSPIAAFLSLLFHLCPIQWVS